MRSAYRLNLTGPGAIWAPSALLVLALLVFAFAPMRPVASAQPKAANIAVGTSANMIFAAGITKDSVPPTGSGVAPGQVIVYNITASNGVASCNHATRTRVRAMKTYEMRVDFVMDYAHYPTR